MGRFIDFYCPVCGQYLCSVYYKNTGMLKDWCDKCRKTYIINDLKIVKDPK